MGRGPARAAIHAGRTGSWPGSDQTTYPGDPGQVPRPRSSTAWQRASGPMCTGQAGSARYHRCHPGRCPLSGCPGVRTDTRGGQVKQPPRFHRPVAQPAQRVHHRRAVGRHRCVDVHQDQLSVAEQFAATAADMGIQPGRPEQPPPPGELVDVALCRVPGHRQARGLECARGDPGRLAAAGRLPGHEQSAAQHGRHHVLCGVHPPTPHPAGQGTHTGRPAGPTARGSSGQETLLCRRRIHRKRPGNPHRADDSTEPPAAAHARGARPLATRNDATVVTVRDSTENANRLIDLYALVIGRYLCRWRAELVDLRSAPGPFTGWWLRSRGGHASRGTAGGTPRPGRTRTPG